MWTYNYTDEPYHYGGQGAGTCRKLMNHTVKERSKNPAYKKAFDEALSNQDMAKHATKAQHERTRKDIKKKTAKTGRGLANIATGHPERVGAGLAVLAAGVTVAHKTGADRYLINQGKKFVERMTAS